MNNSRFRIELIVLDIVERAKLPQDAIIVRNGLTLYAGSVNRIPKELLNEYVIKIYTTEYNNYLGIEIE